MFWEAQYLKLLKCISLVLFLSIFGANAKVERLTKVQQSDILRFAVVGISGQQREVLLSLAYEFERQHIQKYIRYVFLNDELLKKEIHEWMRGTKSVDLILWQAGERLFQFARQGQVANLNEFWQVNELDTFYPKSIKPLVTFEENLYAVPVSYYNWGFFYNPSLFNKLQISPPDNWQEMLQVVETLDRHGVQPLAIGTKEGWPVSAWFEYINLRVNGLAFHKKILNGSISFEQPEVVKVMTLWAELLNKANFSEKHQMLLWRDTLPDLFRQNSGMALLGGFMTQLIPVHLKGKIDYFPFPQIDASVAHYELAPTDVLVVPQVSQNKQLAYDYIQFLIDPDNQAKLNEGFGQFSLHQKSKMQHSALKQKGLDTLLQADGLTQYVDRDAPEELAGALIPIWVEFLDSRNVSATIKKMEIVRKSYLASTSGSDGF